MTEGVQVKIFPLGDVDRCVNDERSRGNQIVLAGCSERGLVGVILPQRDLNVTVDIVKRQLVEELANTKGQECGESFTVAHETNDAHELYDCYPGGGIDCLVVKKKKKKHWSVNAKLDLDVEGS